MAAAYCVTASTVKLRRVSIDVAPLAQVDAAEPDLSGAGFARDRVYTHTQRPPFTGAVKFYGSWASPKPLPGSVHSAWYKAVPHFSIFFAGYPNLWGNHLLIEVETAKAGLIRLPVPPELIPGEAWWLKNFSLPQDKQPLRFRIVANTVPLDWRGWLGFSEPFLIRSVDHLEVCKQVSLFVLTLAAACVAFLSPGLMLRERRRNLHFIWVPVPGMLLLALIGLLAWCGPAPVSPRLICRIGLFSLVAYAVYHAFRFPLSTYTTSTERRALFVSLLLISIAGAKTIYSPGPSGELNAGRISRTYEVGARSDSTISYHGVHLVQIRESPFSEFAASLYAPWSYSDRGPIPSLAVSPVMLSARIGMPQKMPDQPWSPFDPEGFSSYRAGMIVLACCGLLMVFGFARMFLPEDWALFAFLVAVTAPFTIHEIWFTWPKLATAGFVFLAAYLTFRRRFLLSGFMLGLGYLVHPSALMSVPALLGILLLLPRRNPRRFAWRAPMAALFIGLGFWLVLWRLVNSGHYAQCYFLTYLAMIPHMGPHAPHTVAGWLDSRVTSALNTLVPLNLILFHRYSLDIQSIYAFSPPVIQFFSQYWNTLPFASGIVFFFVGLLRLLYVGCRKWRAWFFALFVIPLVVFVVYWGWSSSGLMREGLHAWFLGLMLFSIIVWHRFLPASGRFFQLCNWALLFRGVETICVLLLPTIASQHVIVQPPFVLSDTIALVVMSAGTLYLYFYVFCRAEELRRSTTGRSQQPSRAALQPKP